MNYFWALCFFCLYALAASVVYFEETFSDDSWEKNWIYSEHSGKKFEKFILSAEQYYKDPDNKGIKTYQDARFYALSKKFKPFSNKGKPLVIQFFVKHEQNIDCGNGYVKIYDCSLNKKDMHRESRYFIMFGPDICGPGTKKVHVIFNYKGKNHLINKEIICKDDVLRHLYGTFWYLHTLIVKPDKTYFRIV